MKFLLLPFAIVISHLVVATANDENVDWKSRHAHAYGLGSNLAIRSINDVNNFQDYSWSGTNRNETLRSTIVFDDLFQIVQGWQGDTPFYLDRIIQRKEGYHEAKSFYNSAANVSPEEVKQSHPGAYIFKKSCILIIERRQHELNEQCMEDDDCKDVFIGLNVWGTFGKMNFKQDGLLYRTCSIVKTDSADDYCLSNFPFSSSCYITFVEDHTPSANRNANKYADGKMKAAQIGKASTKTGLISLIQQYSHKIKKSFTLPNGQLTYVQEWITSGNEEE